MVLVLDPGEKTSDIWKERDEKAAKSKSNDEHYIRNSNFIIAANMRVY